MRIYTGRSRLMEAALIDTLRGDMAAQDGEFIVVVPKQLTLQTERTLLKALGLKGSFQLQVLSPERLCQRIFSAAGTHMSSVSAARTERKRTMIEAAFLIHEPFIAESQPLFYSRARSKSRALSHADRPRPKSRERVFPVHVQMPRGSMYFCPIPAGKICCFVSSYVLLCKRDLLRRRVSR